MGSPQANRCPSPGPRALESELEFCLVLGPAGRGGGSSMFSLDVPWPLGRDVFSASLLAASDACCLSLCLGGLAGLSR